MNGPKRKPAWSWALMPQEGWYHLMIMTIALGDKTFLAYSGIGDGVRASELTNQAIERMGKVAASQHVMMDLRKSMKPDLRVRTAFEAAEPDSIVLFLSPDDPSCAEVFTSIAKGRKMEPIR